MTVESIQIKETLAYPWASENVLKRLLIGATITLFGIFAFPLFISFGYYTRSLTDTIAGEDNPPALSKSELWPLFKLGGGAIVILGVYALLTTIAAVGLTAAFGVATTGGLIGENIAAHMTTFAVVAVLLGIGTAYIAPASLARYGQSGSVFDGFRVLPICTTTFTLSYLLGMAFSVMLLGVVFAVLALSSLIPPVGIVLALCSKFPTVLLISRAHGNGISA